MKGVLALSVLCVLPLVLWAESAPLDPRFHGSHFHAEFGFAKLGASGVDAANRHARDVAAIPSGT